MAHILVVDDDPIARAVLAEILIQGGHEVSQAEDGIKAMNTYRRHPADVVVTDIFMPEKEGLEMVREMKKEYPDARFIAISGGSSAARFDSLEWIRLFGVKHTFTKPPDRDKILAAVDELLAS